MLKTIFLAQQQPPRKTEVKNAIEPGSKTLLQAVVHDAGF
jgi:hypothetical protein